VFVCGVCVCGVCGVCVCVCVCGSEVLESVVGTCSC